MKQLFYVLLIAITMVSCEGNLTEVDAPKSIELTEGTPTSQTIYADQITDLNGGIKFTAKGPWEASVNLASRAGSDVDWLSLSKYSGNAGDFTLLMTIKLNTSGMDRKAEITINCLKSTVTIVVEQKKTTQAGGDLTIVKIPDAAFKAYLLANYDTNHSGEMEREEMTYIDLISIYDENIKSLEGIEYCSRLSGLSVYNTPITLFDFTATPYLYDFRLGNPSGKDIKIIAPSLKMLDLDTIPDHTKVTFDASKDLIHIGLLNTSVSHVDLSKYPNLQSLFIKGITIERLDLSSFPKLTTFGMLEAEVGELIISNPDLENFSFNSSKTARIDLSSSVKLKRESLDISGQNYIEYLDLANIELITDDEQTEFSLNSTADNFTIISKKIKDISIVGTLIKNLNLSGCEVLECLYLSEHTSDSQQNPIEGSLKLTAGATLSRIRMYESAINSLDITNSKGVKDLLMQDQCSKTFKLIGADSIEDITTQFSENAKCVEHIDISGCTSLQKFESSYMTQLKSLDVSGATSLKLANIGWSKQLASVKFTGCSSLRELYCQANGIEELDVTGCNTLAQLWCAGNKIVTLDLSTCNILNDIYLLPHNYPLQCYMSTLKTLYLKTGWRINGINLFRRDEYIHPETVIEYK